MRAYRPSYFSGEDSDLQQLVRQKRLRIYQERASARLPLFDVAGYEAKPPGTDHSKPTKH